MIQLHCITVHVVTRGKLSDTDHPSISWALSWQPMSTRKATRSRLPEHTALCRQVAPLSLVWEQLPSWGGKNRNFPC